jgi:hypothetical protein
VHRHWHPEIRNLNLIADTSTQLHPGHISLPPFLFSRGLCGVVIARGIVAPEARLGTALFGEASSGDAFLLLRILKRHVFYMAVDPGCHFLFLVRGDLNGGGEIDSGTFARGEQ